MAKENIDQDMILTVFEEINSKITVLANDIAKLGSSNLPVADNKELIAQLQLSMHDIDKELKGELEQFMSSLDKELIEKLQLSIQNLDKELSVKIDSVIEKVSIKAEKSDSINPQIKSYIIKFSDYLKALNAKIDSLKNEKKVYRKEYTFDFKAENKKAAFLWLILFSLFSISFACNLGQVFKNVAFEDSDWKYRYLKMQKGVKDSDISRLEDVFKYQRDKKAISKIKNDVAEHEKLVQERAEKLNQSEFNEMESQRLKKEAEEKNKEIMKKKEEQQIFRKMEKK